MAKGKSRGKPRRRRERAPIPGLLVHQDGSTHEWVPGTRWDLIVTMDDATSEVHSGFFVEEEGTWSSLRGVRETLTSRGLFCSLYTDRGSHYWRTAQAGGKVDKASPTQELAHQTIVGMEDANGYLLESFWPRMNRRFGVKARERGDAFVALGDAALDDILCLKEGAR